MPIASNIAGLLDRLPQHLKAFSSFFRVGTRSVASAAETYLLALLPHRAYDPDSVAELIAERHQQRQSARE